MTSSAGTLSSLRHAAAVLQGHAPPLKDNLTSTNMYIFVAVETAFATTTHNRRQPV